MYFTARSGSCALATRCRLVSQPAAPVVGMANSTGTSFAFSVCTKLKLYGAMSICSCCHSVAKAPRLAPMAPTFGSNCAQRLEGRLEVGFAAALDAIQFGEEGDAELAVERGQADAALVFRIPQVFPALRRRRDFFRVVADADHLHRDLRTPFVLEFRNERPRSSATSPPDIRRSALPSTASSTCGVSKNATSNGGLLPFAAVRRAT